MQHLQPNTTLQGGKYRIERVLGQGGFGITYLAHNTVFDVDVAIKEFFMKDENGRDGSSVTMPNTTKQELFHGQMEKLKKEAKRMFAIKNEHIIGVQDLFEENGTAYYVMEYVDGENLAERLKRTGKSMTEQEVRAILPQILDALKSVHDAGIWHLDLKPANIMVDKSGNVKLIDFGASKQLNTQKGGATTSTAISYTNGYAPREQMEQNYDKFGPWTDIYALGATLYALLTNKRPSLPTDIDDDITSDKHMALPLSDRVSEEMKKLILKMMHTNHRQRPQSINELQNSLEMVPFVSKVKNKELTDDEETIVIQKQNDSTVFSIDGKNKVGLKENENKTFLNKWYRKSYSRYALISALVVCVGLLIFWNNKISDNKKEELKYKPHYKVLDPNNKTCELFGSVPQTENGVTISDKLFYGVILNNACIPNSANGKYNIPQKVDDFKVVKLGDFSFCYTNLSSVNIPEGIKSIGDYAFARCEKLVCLIISDGVESIGTNCCEYDYLLSEINLPASLASIGNYAFASCESLKSIILPNSLSVIGAGAFRDCSNLGEVFSNIQNPLNCELGQFCFDHIASDAKLYIPYGTKELYIKAGWAEHFSKIIER